jgi:hypothetical protein
MRIQLSVRDLLFVRLRPYFIPTLLLLPLIFVCGKLLLAPLSRMIDDPDVARRYTIIDAGGPPAAVRGWPWVFLKTVSWNWPQTAPIEVFYISWSRLAADLAVYLLVLAAAAALLARHRRRRGAWLRFSLREMFALTAAVAIALSWWTIHGIEYGREHNTVAFLTTKGCWAEFLPVADCAPEWLQRLLPEDRLTIFQRVGTAVKTPKTTSRADFNWLSAAVAHLPCVTYLDFGVNSPPYGSHSEDGTIPDAADFNNADPAAFAHITRIGFSGIDVAEDLVQWLGPLPSLREFRAFESPITDQSLEQISKWEALEHLEVYGPALKGPYSGAKITDAGVAQLASLPNLREIYLQNLDITDASAETISRMSSLETVGFRYNSRVTNAALLPLAKLPRLRHLDLCGSKITDAGIEAILKLKDLQILELYECQNLTAPALGRLIELPNLIQLNISSTANISEETLKQLKQRVKSLYMN